MRQSKTCVCWISSARYSDPLDAASVLKWQLLSGLHEYEIRILGFSTSLRPRRFTQSVDFYLLPQAPLSLLRYLTMFGLAPLILLYLILWQRGAIIVAQSPFEGAIAALVKIVAGVLGRRPSLIVENHNNFEEDVFLQRKIPLKSLYRWLMLAAARFAFRHADAVRVISSSTAERARHYAPHRPQVRFMTWSDTDIFRNFMRHMPVSEAKDIVFAGVLTPGKGVHHLLSAFHALDEPGTELHLVGQARNRDYAAALQTQAMELGIGERVHFVGAVPQADLAAYFASARVMVLPSLSEGLGRVVVEAMLLGTPVIGSRVGGIPDLIRDGENGYLVEPGDEGELTTALRRIYEIDVEAMGEKARAFAEAFFSPQKYVDGYRELFELVGRDTPSDTKEEFMGAE